MIKEFFTTGIWIGKGTITLSMLEDVLPIWVRFQLDLIDPNESVIKCSAEYHIVGHQEPITNFYTFGGLFKDRFEVALENEAWGKAAGSGFIEGKTIGLEFKKGKHGFEGYESYTFLDDNTFLLKGEFLTEEELRSEISAKVMKHVESPVLQ